MKKNSTEFFNFHELQRSNVFHVFWNHQYIYLKKTLIEMSNIKKIIQNNIEFMIVVITKWYIDYLFILDLHFFFESLSKIISSIDPKW